MKAFAFLSISFLTFNLSFCQLNDSIIDKNKIWYNYIYIYNTMWVDTEVISFGSDTIINDTSYNHVLRGVGGVEIPEEKYGFIRESGGKVFYRTNTEKAERLINDFSISFGDTTIVYNLMNQVNDYFIECQFICDSIKDLYYFDIPRKVIYLRSIEGQVPEKWIEGIGSYSGFLHNYNGYVGGDAFYLSCVKTDDKFIFKRNESEPCIKIAVRTETQSNPDLMIHPNPIGPNRELKISNTLDRTIFELYDILGQRVFQEALISPEITLVINVNSGIYFYRFIDVYEKSLKTGKLIFE